MTIRMIATVSPVECASIDADGPLLALKPLHSRNDLDWPPAVCWKSEDSTFYPEFAVWHSAVSKTDRIRWRAIESLINRSKIMPVPVFTINQNGSKNMSGFVYKGHVYKPDRDDCSPEEILMYVRESTQSDKVSPADKMPTGREPIPKEVRIAVWRRDNGACARCGSQERLEYDHIIPVSRGGSNTERNIELLCEAHNRTKSNHIQ